MKRLLCAGIALLMLLTACSAPDAGLSGDYTQGIYEFRLSAKRVSGWPFGGWDFVYTYDGETITSGHRIFYPLDLFSFQSVQVEAIEKNAPDNRYSAALSVAICDGGTGKTEMTVTGNNGYTVGFKITCDVALVGRR